MASTEKKKPRVKVSKNKKKSWNKHCDVSGIEEYLEEKRFDERIGGAVADKTDAELYFVEKDVPKKDERPKVTKQLRCFQSIGAFSKVPPPTKQYLDAPFSKKIKNVLTRADERRRKLALAKASKEVKKTSESILQVGGFFSAEIKDLWDDKGNDKEVDPEIQDLVTFHEEYTCKRTPNVPEHRFQKPSLLPAVEVPHCGASYNPDFADHQDLLLEAVKIEALKKKQEFHLKRVLDDMFPKRKDAPTEQSRLEEMSQGLFGDESEEEASGGTSIYSMNPPVSFENRLTRSRRRKRKERKEEARLKSCAKLQKKRLNQVYRLRSLKKEINQKAQEIKQKVERNINRKIDQMYKPKTLSKHKYEAPNLEVNLSEELCQSLRTLKTQGNLLEDRYKSLQRRNIIEPRKREKRKRKYKLKVQVKRNHRNFT